MKKVLSSTFLKSFLILASGSLIAQIVTAVVTPISAILFTTEELGSYTLLLSIINIATPILSLRYDYMIIPESSEKRVFVLIKLSLLLSLIISSVISVLYFVYSLVNGNGQLFLFTFILFMMMLLNGIINVLTAYNNRNNQYKVISSTYVIRTIMQNLFLVLSGVFKMGELGLMGSQVLGTAFGIKKQYRYLKKDYYSVMKVNKLELKEVSLLYNKQLLYSTPAAFLNTFSYNSINFIISFLFGTSTLGVYSISYRLLGLPLSLISNNISKIYFSNASSEYQKLGTFVSSFKKIIICLIPVSLLMFIFLFLFSPFLFEILFGEEWSGAGTMVRILSPMFSIKIISSTLGPSIWITQKQKYDMIFQFLLVSDIIICFCFGLLLDLDINNFLLIYSFSSSCIYIYTIFVHFKLSKGDL